MARKGENIFLRKDGRWEARYVKSYDINNKIVYGYVYGKTYSIAKKKRNEMLLTLNTKQIERKDKIQKNSFINLCNSWLLQKRLGVKQSSYSRYVDIVNNHLIPYFGDIEKDKINNDLASNFIISKIKLGLSNKTIKDIVVVLKQITKYGNINITINSPKVIPKAVKIMGIEDQVKLESYIKNNFDNIELGIFIALYMGLRIGEVCGLKWKNVDIENQVIYVYHTVSRVKNMDENSRYKTKVIIDEPKTINAKRTIPIPPTIIPFFKAIKNKNSNEENFILTNSKKLIEPRCYYNKYKKILKKLEIAGFNFHALRHTFATRCIELGFDPKTLMEILGHSDIKITLAFYVHPTDNLKVKSMEKLSLLDI